MVLNYNGWRDTAKCLRSVAKLDYKDYQVYLVDNSDRNKEEEIAKLKEILTKIPHLSIVKFDIQTKNTGFAGGVNLGITYALENNFDAVALLNSDACVEKTWLSRLVRAMKYADATTGLMVDETGEKIINSGDVYTRWGVPEQRDEGLSRECASESGEVFGATGGAVLYSTKIFREIGLFDEKLFAYNEDVDIAWRARLAGYKFYYEKSAIVYHKGGNSSSSAFKTRQVFANLPVVMWKNVPGVMLWPVLWRFFLAYLMFFGFKIIRGEGWPALCGIIRSWRLWPHALYERRKIMCGFRAKFPNKKSRRAQLEIIKKLIKPELPFKNIQRLKKFFRLS